MSDRGRPPVMSFVVVAVLVATFVGYFTTGVSGDRTDCNEAGGVYARANSGSPGVNWLGYACVDPRPTDPQEDS